MYFDGTDVYTYHLPNFVLVWDLQIIGFPYISLDNKMYSPVHVFLGFVMLVISTFHLCIYIVLIQKKSVLKYCLVVFKHTHTTTTLLPTALARARHIQTILLNICVDA